jgi:uncharacterized membrane protein
LRLDLALELRVLVDVADRALSPAVNDPYTACQSINEMKTLLGELAGLPLGDRELFDDASEAMRVGSRASSTRPPCAIGRPSRRPLS